MGVSFQLDHLVIAVIDLEQAVADYLQLGFNVVPGGRHQHTPTQNALVYFADGTYLELIEWTMPVPGEKWYEHLTQHGEGLVDFAFVPSKIGDTIAHAAERGVQYRGPIDGSRIKPTGEHVQWQLGWPVSRALPFLCGDVTPRSLRVPDGEVRKHRNQASGITSIAIRVDNLDDAAEAYRALLGSESDTVLGVTHSLEAVGLDVLSIQLGSTQLHLVAPLATEESTAGERFRSDLKRKGQGVYRLCVDGLDDAPSKHEISQLKHGVPLLITHKNLTLLEQIDYHE